MVECENHFDTFLPSFFLLPDQIDRRCNRKLWDLIGAKAREHNSLLLILICSNFSKRDWGLIKPALGGVDYELKFSRKKKDSLKPATCAERKLHKKVIIKTWENSWNAAEKARWWTQLNKRTVSPLANSAIFFRWWWMMIRRVMWYAWVWKVLSFNFPALISVQRAKTRFLDGNFHSLNLIDSFNRARNSLKGN